MSTQIFIAFFAYYFIFYDRKWQEFKYMANTVDLKTFMKKSRVS